MEKAICVSQARAPRISSFVPPPISYLTKSHQQTQARLPGSVNRSLRPAPVSGGSLLRSLKGRSWWCDIFAAFYLCLGEVSDPRKRGLPPFDPLPPKPKLFSRTADFLKQEKVVSFSKIFPRSSFLSFPGFNLPPASLPYPAAKSFPLSNSFATNKNSFRVFICKASTS